MNFTTKVYLYDSSKSDYRGTDYSKYVLIGDSDEDNLDDTLDTYTLTLAGLDTREEFAPSTKFIVEKWQEGSDTAVNTWNFVVQSDSVEQPIISDDTYFDHHLSLIEAGAIAQHRLVDNIAVTYKLEDVSLDQVPKYDENQKVNLTQTNAFIESQLNYGYYDNSLVNYGYVWGHKFEWVMPTWLDTSEYHYSFDTWKNLLYNQTVTGESGTITLPIPILRCYGPTKGTKNLDRLNGYCSIKVEITEKKDNNDIRTDSYEVLPNSKDSTETVWTVDDKPTIELADTGRGEIISAFHSTHLTSYRSGLAKWGTTYDGVLKSTTTPFTTLLNRKLTITMLPTYTYSIKVTRLGYPKSTWTNPTETPIYNLNYEEYPAVYDDTYINWFQLHTIITQLNYQYPIFSTDIACYSESVKGKIVFQSAPPATAYELFNKCQIASTTIEKVEGTSIDETPKMFYLGEEDKTQLQNTTIIENFYNQKNLWELFMDIGKYIHARPKIVYGDDDRFKVEWKRYGQTDEYTDNATPISVYNSRFIEEYIASVSSYVTNMVQLGGTITETVSPKSNSEDYLVYNDVAEIIVSKPIIELIELVAINNTTGAERYLATNDKSKLVSGEREYGYVFEKNVWNILAATTDTNINRGNSIYYELGDNKIQGLTYQLPTRDNNADYAIKVILGEVYGISTTTDIKVNDYSFRITYRTKDTLRTDQSRPDLRKYLLSSKYDEVPTHQQFNNQQDVVVDSAKFGNNIYGKLIRTGNTVYSRVEWVDDLTKLKHSGELYNIYGNLYYVSKVKNTYYDNYATSEVEFTKDFNRLSQIIGIPSEPRFYEISEQSSIDREKSISDYLLVSTSSSVDKIRNYLEKYYYNVTAKDGTTYVWSESLGYNMIASYIGGEKQCYYPALNVTSTTKGEYYTPIVGLGLYKVTLPDDYKEGALYFKLLDVDYPRYAISIFKGDINKNSNFKKAIISPVSTYSIENTLTMEWDMVDNFSAGNKVDPSVSGLTSTADKSYYGLQAVGYTDTMGRADLIDFAILPYIDTTGMSQSDITSIIQGLPECPSGIFKVNEDGSIETDKIIPLFGNEDIGNFGTNDKGIGLLKDNREVIKMNYNIQIITDSDRFILSSYIWQKDKGSLKMAFLDKEFNKLSNSTFTLDNSIITTMEVRLQPGISIGLRLNEWLIEPGGGYAQGYKSANELLGKTKSIVVYSENQVNYSQLSNERYFVLARNVADLPSDTSSSGKGASWSFGIVPKDYFTKQ